MKVRTYIDRLVKADIVKVITVQIPININKLLCLYIYIHMYTYIYCSTSITERRLSRKII